VVETKQPILTVRDLVVQFRTEHGYVTAVDGLTLEVQPASEYQT